MGLELLALYKEVQDQYDTGRLEVPDDVTLLFADDDFGTIRRLPQGKEAERKGGAGVCCVHGPHLLILTFGRYTTILNMSDIREAISGLTATHS